MNIIKFYNREKELDILDRVKKPYLAIIYGRRRIGKTTLILHHLRDKEFLYFFVNPRKSESLLLREFTQLLKEKNVIEEFVRPKNWEEFFKIIFERYEGVVVFDEFQWFERIDKSIPFILQRYWDMYKKPNIVISGSIIGMIKDIFTEEGSPLFKRGDIIIKLKPFDAKTCFQILDDLGIEDLERKFEFYLLFGGVPYYYRFMERYDIMNIEDCIKVLVLDENAPLRNEVEEIMKEAFRGEYRTYLSILFAIAEGKTKIEEITGYSDIKPTSLMPYLYDLIDLLGLVEKQRIGFKKKYIYEINDFFHRFWLRYVYKYSNELIFNQELVFEIIKKDISNFFGINFERFVREFVKEYFKEFPRVMKYIGFFRSKGKRKVFDMDILALNDQTREILFVECKWQNGVNAKKICKELVEKSQYVQWYNETRREKFAIFAKSFTKKISKFDGKEVFCFDLEDIVTCRSFSTF